jgi:hypothetical protein
MLRVWAWIFAGAATGGALWSCGSGASAPVADEEDIPDATTPRGFVGAPCHPNGTCDPGLVCIGGLCQADGDASPFFDGGEDASLKPPCDGDAGCARVVFVTSTAYFGNMVGGFDGGNEKCNTAANAVLAHPVVTGRDYVAWLSNGGSHAADRLVHGDAPYVLADGTVVATDWNQLTTATLLSAAIAQDERGVPRPGLRVWTGSDRAGMDTGMHCADWMGVGAGTAGSTSARNAEWSAAPGDLDCVVQQAHLYCIER